MADLLNQFTYFAFFQSLFLIVIFIVSASKRERVNTYLLILVCLLLVGLVGNLGHFNLNWSRQMKGLSEFSILFFGPTIYLFVQSSLSEKSFSKSDWVHYVPGVIYSLIVFFYYMHPPMEIIQDRVDSGELYRVVHILVGIGLTVNITYYVLSVLKYRSLKSKLQDEVSYFLNIGFTRNFLIAIGACLSIWLIVYFCSFGSNNQVEINFRSFIWTAIAFVVLFIAYYQMVSPSVFQFDRVIFKTKYNQSKFSQIDLDRLKLELEKIIENEKPHLNSRLLKSELAEMIGINAPELSRLLNERIGMNFFEFINYHRIHEFIRLAKSPLIEQKTLLGLAQEAGFQSKSTFNKSFKKIMGCPPSVYLKEMI